MVMLQVTILGDACIIKVTILGMMPRVLGYFHSVDEVTFVSYNARH